MSQVIKVNKFNSLLDDFFNFLSDNFPEYQSDIFISQQAVNMIKIGNPRLVVENFMTNIRPFRTHIFNLDESFFLDYEENVMSNLNGVDRNYTNDLCKKIKQVWLSSSTTDNHKATVWWYFRKLINLGEKIDS